MLANSFVNYIYSDEFLFSLPYFILGFIIGVLVNAAFLFFAMLDDDIPLPGENDYPSMIFTLLLFLFIFTLFWPFALPICGVMLCFYGVVVFLVKLFS